MALPILEQAKDFFAKLTTVQKASIGTAVAAAIAGIVLLITSTSAPSMAVLFSELESKDAGAIVEKLKEQNIEYELSANGSSVSVPQEKVSELRLSLAQEGIPANSTVGYEIFDKTNLGMSDMVQKLNYKRALEGELQKTIAAFEEVKKVRVMIVQPEKALFDKDQKKTTASVHLQFKSGRSLSKINIESIQNLVAFSVEGLQPNDVMVVDSKGQILSEIQKDKSTLAGLSATQYEQQQKIDEYLTQKVQSQLDGVLGAGSSSVRVNAELDFTQKETTQEQYDPETQVIHSEERIAAKRKSQDSLDYPAVNSEADENKVAVNYLNSKKVERVVGSVGTIKRLSVSVMVNGTTKIQEEPEPKIIYTPRSPEEMTKLQQIVENAVGFDATRNDKVSVVNMPFDMRDMEEELKNKGLDLPMEPQDIAEKLLILLAMGIAVWMIRKLFASPEIRRKIEEIITPPKPVNPQDQLAQLALANGMIVTPDGKLLPAAKPDAPQLEESTSTRMDKEELLAKARLRLDQNRAKEMTEEQLMKDEMKARIQQFFKESETEGVKLVKVLITRGAEQPVNE